MISAEDEGEKERSKSSVWELCTAIPIHVLW